MHRADNQDASSSGTPPEDTGSTPTTNTRASAASTAQPGWSVDGAAADFLGLDQEVASFQGGSTPGAAPGQGGETLDGSNSWLFSLEGEPAASSTDAPEDELAEQAPGAEPLEEGVETEGADAPFEAPALARKGRSRVLLYALAGCAVIAAGGGFAWKTWQARTGGESTTVALVPRPPKPAPKAPPKEAVVPSDPAPTTSTELVTNTPETTPAPSTTTPGTAFEFGPRASDARVDGFLAAHGASAGADGLPTGNGSSTLPLIARDVSDFALPTGRLPADLEPAPGVPAPEMVEHVLDPERRVTPSNRSKLRLATDEDLTGVWQGNTIPTEAIAASVRLTTPAVGRVRVTIYGGELFEGRLYAVGQQLLWLDTTLGRMAIDGYRVARIEQLSSPDGTPVLGAGGSHELAGLPRMRVRTPGGMLYGKVIGRDERSVTLVTEAGARITIDTTEVEPAPQGRSVIVRGLEKPTQP